MLRQTLLALSESPRARVFAQHHPVGRRASRRFVAGETQVLTQRLLFAAKAPTPERPARAEVVEPVVEAPSLLIVSEPPGASVYLDDELVGTTDPETGRLLRGDVAPGDHRIRLSLPGRADRVAEILVKYEPRIKGRENIGVFGAITMMTVVEGLKRARRDLTREKFIQALEGVRDWRPEGLGAPITFGPTRHHGLNTVRLMQAEHGRLVPVTGYQMFPSHF